MKMKTKNKKNDIYLYRYIGKLKNKKLITIKVKYCVIYWDIYIFIYRSIYKIKIKR